MSVWAELRGWSAGWLRGSRAFAGVAALAAVLGVARVGGRGIAGARLGVGIQRLRGAGHRRHEHQQRAGPGVRALRRGRACRRPASQPCGPVRRDRLGMGLQRPRGAGERLHARTNCNSSSTPVQVSGLSGVLGRDRRRRGSQPCGPRRRDRLGMGLQRLRGAGERLHDRDELQQQFDAGAGVRALGCRRDRRRRVLQPCGPVRRDRLGMGLQRRRELGNGCTLGANCNSSSTPVRWSGSRVSSRSPPARITALRSGPTVRLGMGLQRLRGLGTAARSGRTATAVRRRVQVSGLSGVVVAIAAGGSHSLAVRSDGTVWAWGSNVSGQLGNGCTLGTNCNSSSTPVQVSGLSGVVAIAGGTNHSLAVRSDGTVWGWGETFRGAGERLHARDGLQQQFDAGAGVSRWERWRGDRDRPRGSHVLLSQPGVGLAPSSLGFSPGAVGSVSSSRSVTVSNPGMTAVVVPECRWWALGRERVQAVWRRVFGYVAGGG